MKFVICLSLVIGGVLGSFAATRVFALFTDQQSATGTVSVTTATDVTDVYICDVSGTGSTSATCPGVGDDSGPNEIIFESLENLLPGQTAQWDFQVRNIGTHAWDTVQPPNPGVVEVNDPGSDCNGN